ncbi:MAG TPA: CRISPR-associated helicase Cas3' [Actinomycetaceae bacterium]|nr:CRISPR-associated helicase Cas3' [Actinomycetaceae bacterium]
MSRRPDGRMGGKRAEGPGLGPAARSVWAKSGNVFDGTWLPLHQHLADAAGIAGVLFDRWVAPQLRRILAEPFGGSEEDARSCLVFLAGTHDLGKCTPAFASKVPRLAEHMEMEGLTFPDWPLSAAEKQLYQHSNLSHITLRRYLIRSLGLDEEVATSLASVTAAHHGFYPTNLDVSCSRFRPDWVGEGEWERARTEMIERAIWMANLGDRAEAWNGLRWSIPTLAAMGALVVVADWLASAEDFFPLWDFPDSFVLSQKDHRARTEEAWTRSGFTGPWDPQDSDSAEELYDARFGDDTTRFVPYPTQSAALELVRSHMPRLLLVEAPMGSGKTELGLVCAEIMAAQNGAGGLLFALPTMATTNAIFGRIRPWLDRAQVADSEGHQSISLTHGSAELNEDFLKLLPTYNPPEIHDDDVRSSAGGLTALVWMTRRWRKTLSNVVVSTVDHVLMAALLTRHFPLRLLGLLGKVVLIDEVHSSDAYMSVYLERALTLLGSAGVPVVLLSATLAPSRRRQLVEAYLDGAQPPAPRVRRRVRRSERGTARPDAATRGRECALAKVAQARGYPLLTVIPHDSREPLSVGLEAEPAGSVLIDIASQSDEALVGLVGDALSDGGCVGVIRSTVANAQATAQLLQENLPGTQVVLAHSRFTSEDRAGRDAELLRLLGKGPGTSRPTRCVIVATQVIEQSLDIDLDYLITDPAPMDLILQRIGRLHRHAGRERPPRLKEARCTVLVADTQSVPWQIDGGTKAIYGASAVLRMLGAIATAGGELTVALPGGIAELVTRAASDSPHLPDSWEERVREEDQKARDKDRNSRSKAETYLVPARERRGSVASFVDQFSTADRSGAELDGGAHGIGDARGRAAVRDTEDRLSVILVPMSEDGLRVILPPVEGEDEIVVDTSVMPSDDLARRIRAWSIDVPHRQLLIRPETPDDAIDSIITELEKSPAFGWAWQRHPLLRGELFLCARRDSAHGNLLIATLRGKSVHYDSAFGLRVIV